MVWTQIRTDILSVLIWVQPVCRGYWQTTNVATSKERVNSDKSLDEQCRDIKSLILLLNQYLKTAIYSKIKVGPIKVPLCLNHLF